MKKSLEKNFYSSALTHKHHAKVWKKGFNFNVNIRQKQGQKQNFVIKRANFVHSRTQKTVIFIATFY